MHFFICIRLKTYTYLSTFSMASNRSSKYWVLGIIAFMIIVLIAAVLLIVKYNNKHRISLKVPQARRQQSTPVAPAPNRSPINKYDAAVHEARRTGQDEVAMLHQASLLPLQPYEKPYAYLDRLHWPNFDAASYNDWGPPPGVSAIDASVVPW